EKALEEAKQKTAELGTLASRLKIEYEQAEKLQENNNILTAQIEAEQLALPGYEKLEFILNETGQKKQQLEKEEHLLEKSRQEAQKMKLQREKYQQQLAGLKDSGAALERTAAQISVNEQQCRKTEVLQEKVVQNKNLVNEMYRSGILWRQSNWHRQEAFTRKWKNVILTSRRAYWHRTCVKTKPARYAVHCTTQRKQCFMKMRRHNSS
ncbi:MAG TPA: hypothetical protein PK462_06020, partial [Lachnospira sp.]|nr:hypothetical protein [Lachnospira sp.]